jgi:hypothetical protein
MAFLFSFALINDYHVVVLIILIFKAYHSCQSTESNLRQVVVGILFENDYSAILHSPCQCTVIRYLHANDLRILGSI